jgi:hypothetical protein
MTSGLGHNQTQNGSTSSAEVFPAKIFPTPDEVPALKDQEAGYSLKPFAWFANYDRGLLCWRTWQRCLLEGWTEFSERWPRSGLMRNGIAYRLPPLVPRISGTGFSFWPTPHASCSTEAGSGPQKQGGENLQSAVKFWPTPRSSDGDKGTRTVAGAMKEMKRGKNVDLGVAVQVWPTPTATDSIKGGNVSQRPGAMGLSETLGGQLNPQWVEWLMGFPSGWTDLEDSETQSCHKSQNGSDSE